MKKIAIVGGGITGCVAALYAAKKNFDVHLIEKDKKLGGILQDVSYNKNNYFRACQYLNPWAQWYKNILSEELDLVNFDHQKGTFTEIFNEETLHEDIAGPVLKDNLKMDNKVNIDLNNASLTERLQVYPEIVSSNMQKWFKSFKINPDLLSNKSATAFAVGRIFFRGNVNEIKVQKNNSKKLDDLLGLTRDEIGLKNIEASIPRFGYDKFFEKFYDSLKKNNVKIYLSTVVKPIWNKKVLKLKFGKNEFIPEKVIWTGNPTGLIKNYGLPLLDSMHLESKDFFCNLSGEIKQNKYFQIYSSNIPVSRVFFYKLDGKSKITIESLNSDLDEKEIINFAKKIIHKLNFKLDIESQTMINIKQKKYVLISTRDEKIITKFMTETKNSNLIHGNWLEHARDEKINFLINQINSINQ